MDNVLAVNWAVSRVNFVKFVKKQREPIYGVKNTTYTLCHNALGSSFFTKFYILKIN